MSLLGGSRSKVRPSSTCSRCACMSCTARSSSRAASAFDDLGHAPRASVRRRWRDWYISVMSAQREISSPSICASTSLPMSSAMRTWKSPSSSVRWPTSAPVHGGLLAGHVVAQRADLGGRGAAHERARHLGLEHAAHAEHLARLVHRGRGDKGAARGLQRDEAVLRELEQRLAHQRARDAEVVGQLLLGELACPGAAGGPRWRGSAPRRWSWW